MNRCEDYPACGHGPVPYGDGGGCPDEEGRFNCASCGALLPVDAPSALCGNCRSENAHDYDQEAGGCSPDCRACANSDALWERVCEWETDRHTEHVELGHFVEACDECQNEGPEGLTYIKPEQSIKEMKQEWASG